MRAVLAIAARILAVLCFGTAGIALLLGLLSMPPGGLMFALPYVFFVLALILGLAGGGLFVLARLSAARRPRG